MLLDTAPSVRTIQAWSADLKYGCWDTNDAESIRRPKMFAIEGIFKNNQSYKRVWNDRVLLDEVCINSFTSLKFMTEQMGNIC